MDIYVVWKKGFHSTDDDRVSDVSFRKEKDAITYCLRKRTPDDYYDYDKVHLYDGLDVKQI